MQVIYCIKMLAQELSLGHFLFSVYLFDCLNLKLGVGIAYIKNSCKDGREN